MLHAQVLLQFLSRKDSCKLPIRILKRLGDKSVGCNGRGNP